MLEVNLVSFENDLADFELYNGDEVVTCHAVMRESDLADFLNGEFVVEPYGWFDSEDSNIDKPEWFKEKELKLLNEAFEIGYKEICEGMIDDQRGL